VCNEFVTAHSESPCEVTTSKGQDAGKGNRDVANLAWIKTPRLTSYLSGVAPVAGEACREG